MDSGLIVAGSSIVTLIATGLFGMWNKHIEAKQKVNEHKLTIRAAYVNKKIEAGQKFIGLEVISVHHLNLLQQYYHAIRYDRIKNENMMEKWHIIQERLISELTSNENFELLYFDIIPIRLKVNDLVDSMNSKIVEVDKLVDNYIIDNKSELKDVDSKIDSLIEVIMEQKKLFRETVDLVRKDLAKYDVL